jgi:hypothetical protein
MNPQTKTAVMAILATDSSPSDSLPTGTAYPGNMCVGSSTGDA